MGTSKRPRQLGSGWVGFSLGWVGYLGWNCIFFFGGGGGFANLFCFFGVVTVFVKFGLGFFFSPFGLLAVVLV